MQHIAEAITNLLIKEHIIKEEQAELYSYGLMLILTSGVTTLIILLYGIVRQKLGITIGFLVAFMGLRHYTGGYHAQAYWRCFCISCMFYLISLWSSRQVAQLMPVTVVVIGSWLVSIYLCYVGSLNSMKQPKTEAEMRLRKRYTRILTLLYTIVTTIVCLAKKEVTPIAWLLFYVQVITAFCILIVFLKRGCSYEENSFKGDC